MFGKKTMSSASKFIMAAGRAAGNLKSPKSSVTKTPPKKADPSTSAKPAVKYIGPRLKLGALGTAKKALR